ncbi:hypothetical protein ACH5RR_021484 [Cinchona calisaya]|uniref:Uncharacterized protein n=1 Tax=Cinchona calisaya TaxID=153742 RepID=A0ABD2ZL02_9GENT
MKIPYMNEFGQSVSQDVEHEWIPSECLNKFGHNAKQCSNQSKTIAQWVPKALDKDTQKADQDTAIISQPGKSTDEGDCAPLQKDKENIITVKKNTVADNTIVEETGLDRFLLLQ